MRVARFPNPSDCVMPLVEYTTGNIYQYWQQLHTAQVHCFTEAGDCLSIHRDILAACTLKTDTFRVTIAVANKAERQLQKMGWTVVRPDLFTPPMDWGSYCDWARNTTASGVSLLEIHGQGTEAEMDGKVLGVISQESQVYVFYFPNSGLPVCPHKTDTLFYPSQGVQLGRFAGRKIRPLPHGLARTHGFKGGRRGGGVV